MACATYLDHNATTPLRAEARAAMIAAMDVVGNPSSVHAEGRAAKMLIERARAQVADLVAASRSRYFYVQRDRGGGTGSAQKARHGVFLQRSTSMMPWRLE